MTLSHLIQNILSRIAKRWITPADAASVVALHGAAARAMTIKQKQEAVHAALRQAVGR